MGSLYPEMILLFQPGALRCGQPVVTNAIPLADTFRVTGDWELGCSHVCFAPRSFLFIGCDPLNFPLTLGSYGALILAGLKPSLGLPPLSVGKSNPQPLTPKQ